MIQPLWCVKTCDLKILLLSAKTFLGDFEVKHTIHLSFRVCLNNRLQMTISLSYLCKNKNISRTSIQSWKCLLHQTTKTSQVHLKVINKSELVIPLLHTRRNDSSVIYNAFLRHKTSKNRSYNNGKNEPRLTSKVITTETRTTSLPPKSHRDKNKLLQKSGWRASA